MSVTQSREVSTLQPFWSERSNKQLYRLKVQGITKRIVFSREELEELAGAIHDALGGAHVDRNPH